jgi:hypothetical protein
MIIYPLRNAHGCSLGSLSRAGPPSSSITWWCSASCHPNHQPNPVPGHRWELWFACTRLRPGYRSWSRRSPSSWVCCSRTDPRIQFRLVTPISPSRTCSHSILPQAIINIWLYPHSSVCEYVCSVAWLLPESPPTTISVLVHVGKDALTMSTAVLPLTIVLTLILVNQSANAVLTVPLEIAFVLVTIRIEVATLTCPFLGITLVKNTPSTYSPSYCSVFG